MYVGWEWMFIFDSSLICNVSLHISAIKIQEDMKNRGRSVDYINRYEFIVSTSAVHFGGTQEIAQQLSLFNSLTGFMSLPHFNFSLEYNNSHEKFFGL